MNELEILRIIEGEWRARGLPAMAHHSPEAVALRRAAFLIASKAQQDQRNAAKAASMVGFSVTRGRTHI